MNSEMLQGPALGAVIGACVDRKIIRGLVKNKSEIARDFGMKPASLYGWIETGRVSKHKIGDVLGYFSDVSAPEEWGLSRWPDWVRGIESPELPHPEASTPPEDAPRLPASEEFEAVDPEDLAEVLNAYLRKTKAPLTPTERDLLQAFKVMDSDSRQIVLALVEHLSKR
jgi:hypothetical protein